MSVYYFILDENRNPTPATMEEWGRYFESSDKKILQSRLNGFRISTVFLGIEHHGGMFETMIFKGDSYEDYYCERCETYEEALRQHAEARDLIKKKMVE